MSLKAGVGLEYGVDGYTAGANAAQLAIEQLKGVPNLLMVFASIRYDQNKVLQGVRSVAPKCLIVGSSTAGEITTAGPSEQHSVAVMALQSSEMQFFAGVGENVGKDARASGRMAAEAVVRQAGGPLRAFMMFPDVLKGNGADIVRGILDVLGKNFPVVGGASGDDFEFRETHQYLNDRVYSGATVGLGLTGSFRMGIGVKHGWVPIGEPLTVTRSEGSVLHEVNNKPAISIYQEYFGMHEADSLRKEPLARLAITYPLGMNAVGSDELLIRDPLSVDEHGSITCAAEIPEGSEVRLMVGSREEAVRAAKTAAENAVAQLGGNEPKAVIIFNCIARSKLFGRHSSEEIESIQEVVGHMVPLIGFYTYGEQAPLRGEVRDIKKCNSAFHNETVVICVLSD